MHPSGDFLNKLWIELDSQRSSSSHRLYRGQIAGQIAALLYLRWLDQQEAEREAIASFDEDNYEPTLPERLRWSNWSRLRGSELHRFLTDELPIRLMAVNGTHRARLHHLAIVFERDLYKSDFLFDVILDWLSVRDVKSPAGQDAAARLLDEVIAWAVEDGKYAGEFVTPQSVVELMVELADPQPGNRIYDPCFGSASLLLGCARRLRDRAKLLPLRAWNELRSNSIFGVEINPIWYVIGMTRLVLGGIPEPGLEMGDALERSSQKLSSSEKFDIIVACPPWGARPEIPGRKGNFRFKSKDTENQFLQHVAESLRPGGKAVIAVPEGVLFRSGTDRYVRQWLLDEFRVDGVISLPPGTFAPFTNIKSNLLIFRRDRPANKVRFCVVHSLAGAEQRPSSDSELPTQVARRFSMLDRTELLHDRLGKCELLRVEGTDWMVRSEANGVTYRIPPEKRSEFQVGPEGSRLAQEEDVWETPIKDLARREYELVAKSPGVDQLQRLLDTIKEADESIPVEPLGSIAEVFAGTSYDKGTTVEEPKGNGALAGLIRVADVQEDKIGQPTLFLTAAANEKLNDRLRLRNGDILTSTSGSIGKIAVVKSTHMPLVASKSVVVIRPKEGISSGYLSACLQSESYQTWLSGHARGSTIQNLSVRTLRHLPIAVPDLQLQERVATACEGRKGEALSVLLEFITGTIRDPVVEWLESAEAVRAILNVKVDGKATTSTTLLERLAESCKVMRNRVGHAVDSTPDSRLAAWTTSLSQALEGLRGLSRVPEGTARLSILEGTLGGIAKSTKVIGERSFPAVGLALALCRRIEELVGELRERLLDKIDLRARLDPEVIPVGRTSEVILRLQNNSLLPLRSFSVRTEPPIGKLTLSYLKEHQEFPVPLTIPAQETPGFYDFQAKWIGHRLDGTTAISGSIPLRIEIRAESNAVAACRDADLGSSPYIVGKIIDRPDMLFGREEIIARIKRQFSESKQANVVLLEGNRRMGKSSILKQLSLPGELPGWIVVSIDFQAGSSSESKAGLPTREVFRLIAREIGWQLNDAGIATWFPGMPPPSPNLPFKTEFLSALDKLFAGDRPAEILELYLQDVLVRCKPNKLVLFLDEFDKIQEGIQKGITSPQVPSNIRYLILRYPELSAVFAGSPRLKRMREEYWSALFGLGIHIPVSKLPIEAARSLVATPVAGRLTYVDEARDRLVALCARHPFIIQSLCERVFEDAIQAKTRTVTVSMVEEAAHDMADDFEHFRTLWDYAATARRRLIIALVERLAHGPDPITFSLLEVKLEEAGVVMSDEERLGDDIDFLRELEIVDLDSGPSVAAYTLALPLMGEWIHNNIDFDDLRQKAIKEGQETIA